MSDEDFEALLARAEVLGAESPFRAQVSGEALGIKRAPPKTLRDEFAIAALTGLLMRVVVGPDITARSAYEFADAMIKARGEIIVVED